MAIKKQYRTWNKIPVEIRTNTDTAEVQVWTDSRITLFPGQLASSQAGKPWVVDNKDLLTRNFNGANGTSSTPQEVSKAFLTSGYKVFDNDRAAVLNNTSNYSSTQTGISQQINFFRANVPLVKNPISKQQVSSQGKQSTQQTTTSTPQPEPQTTDTIIQSGAVQEPGSADVPAPQRIPVVPYQEPVKPIPQTLDLNSSTPKSSTILRYPLANLDIVGQELGIGYDFIKIQIVDYINSLNLDTFESGGGVGGFLSNSDVSSKYGQSSDTFATIILPMQSNLSSTNGVDWGSDSANILQLFGGQLFDNYFQRVGGGANPIEGLTKLATEAIQGVGGFADIGVSNKDTIAALMAGYVVGNSNIATRATGSVINPNMEMLFNGPRLRSFNFQFDMTPRFKGESDQIRSIIKTFKKYMSPSKTKGNAFLKSPKVFLLDYIYNGNGASGTGSKHPYLNKFKPCVLTEFNVNYTPDGSYMTYRDDGSMTRYSISMSFAEITPVYQDDYDESNDMGY